MTPFAPLSTVIDSLYDTAIPSPAPAFTTRKIHSKFHVRFTVQATEFYQYIASSLILSEKCKA